MLKKKEWDEDSLPVYDDAMILRRENGVWYYRQWLPSEGKDYRISLKTRSRATAEELGKKEYFALMQKLQTGQKIFSPTIDEAIRLYLEYRQHDIANGAITIGRFQTITTHLKNWRRYIASTDTDTKAKNLSRDCSLGYFAYRSHEKASRTTILNEQSTVNAMWQYLYNRKITDFEALDFGKSPKIDNGVANLTKRQTFTAQEYKQFMVAYKSFKDDATQSEEEKYRRNVSYYYFLLAFESGMRTGELRQLRWENFRAIPQRKNMVQIFVDAATTKVRTSRDVVAKVSYSDFKKALHFEDVNGYVFADLDGTQISEKTLLRHFKSVLTLAEIPLADVRNLVPYSTRHYFATQKMQKGAPMDVLAKIMGTSISQLENTYRHVRMPELIHVISQYENIPSSASSNVRHISEKELAIIFDGND